MKGKRVYMGFNYFVCDCRILRNCLIMIINQASAFAHYSWRFFGQGNPEWSNWFRHVPLKD